MPHEIRYAPNGTRKSVRCKVPKFTEDAIDEVDGISYDTYVCKPYVFYAHDYLTKEELKSLPLHQDVELSDELKF